MSAPRSLPPASPAVRGLPRGEVIGRYGTYADAQKAVDHLADEQFEVDRIAIVGNDLKSVEQVTGRLSYPKVAGQGALNGMVFGAFLGLILSLLGGEQWVSTLLVSVLMGGAFWMLLATITYAMQRGKRDFTSTNQIVATSYDVVAAPEVARRAQQVLQGLRGLQGLPRTAPGPWPQPGARPGPQHGPAQPQQGPPPTQPGAGAPWQRPSGAPEQGPAPAARPEDRGGQPAGPGPTATFQDLPDGRPQYGIRVPAGDPAGSTAAAAPGRQDDPGQDPGGQAVPGPDRRGQDAHRDDPRGQDSGGPRAGDQDSGERGDAGQEPGGPAAGGSTSADASR
ncbi:general stress protein [Kocuria sp. CPCC 205268]|uniref:general stress protein n=1 Tax=Kocuria oxytropis TaxID=3058913 RepID=UPI0034D3EC40